MDTLTHALSGALLARATAPRGVGESALPLGRRVLLGFLAAAAPDLDYVVTFIGPIEYLYHHRGVTHSLILLPLWAYLLARLCAAAWRRDRPWRAYFGVMAMGIAIHIAGDWINSYGTIIFAPFSDERYAVGTTFVIDLWFTGIILVGLAAAALWRRSRLPAIAGMVALCAYVGLQGLLRERAIEWGAAYASAAGVSQARVSAQPRPVSPFNWMVLVHAGEEVRYSFVNLARREALAAPAGAGFVRRLDAAYLPLAQAHWVFASRFGATEVERTIAREAWFHPRFEFFRWFAAEPVLLSVEAGGPGSCAWFQDLRFLTPGRDAWPFRYGMCREAGGEWRSYRLLGDKKVPLS